MAKSGITRRIDELGRIVIPKEIRKNLKIRNSDELEINVENNLIVLNKYNNNENDKIIKLFIKCLGKYLNKNILFTSKERVIEYFSIEKEKLDNIELSNQIIKIIEERNMVFQEGEICIFKDKMFCSYIISPININGDIIGSIIVYGERIEDNTQHIIEFCNMFFQKYLE